MAPDIFLVKGVAKHRGSIYKLWEEGVPPAGVIELTSPLTRREDRAKKRALHACLGVREYYPYDPLGEYLRLPLQGYRLEEGDFRAMTPGHDGALSREALGLRLVLVDGRLRLVDPATGSTLRSPPERADVEAARAEAEATARRAVERRIAGLEALLRERNAP